MNYGTLNQHLHSIHGYLKQILNRTSPIWIQDTTAYSIRYLSYPTRTHIHHTHTYTFPGLHNTHSQTFPMVTKITWFPIIGRQLTSSISIRHSYSLSFWERWSILLIVIPSLFDIGFISYFSFLWYYKKSNPIRLHSMHIMKLCIPSTFSTIAYRPYFYPIRHPVCAFIRFLQVPCYCRNVNINIASVLLTDFLRNHRSALMQDEMTVSWWE